MYVFQQRGSHLKLPCLTVEGDVGDLVSPWRHINGGVAVGKLLHQETSTRTLRVGVRQISTPPPRPTTLFTHRYLVLLVELAEVVEVRVLHFGALGLLHVKPQLEPESCHHLHTHTRTHTHAHGEVGNWNPDIPVCCPPSAHLSGGVDDSVQLEVVRVVGVGVEVVD